MVNDVLYKRIRELCAEKNISLSTLERELNLSSSSVRRWGAETNPSIDKIMKVAKYFNVSIDYLTGLTDTKETNAEILNKMATDKNFISLQRASTKMKKEDSDKMVKLIELAFSYAFDELEDTDKNSKEDEDNDKK